MAHRPRLRDRPDHSQSRESDDRLRLVQRTVRPDESRHGRREAILGRRAVALRERRCRPDLPLPARVADGRVAPRSGDRLLRLAVRPSHARRRGDVDPDQPRPDRISTGRTAGSQWHADHPRRHRRGSVQHAVRDSRVADHQGRDLDRLQRRARACHARRRQDVDERDATGPPVRWPRAERRAESAPCGVGVHRRLSLPARRLCAVRLSHG